MKHIYMLLFILAIYGISKAQVINPSFNPDIRLKNINNLYAIQENGKALIAGNFAYVNGGTRYSIARLNNDGTLDETFNAGDGPNYYISQILPVTENKIVVSGRFTEFGDITANHLVRLNDDGSVDTGFDVGSGPNGNIYDLDTDSDGKLIVAGNFLEFNGIPVRYLARLNNDGSADNTFNSPADLPYYPTGIQIHPDGSIYVIINNTDIIKLGIDGDLDNNFNFDPTNLNSGVIVDMLLEEDGMFIGGNFTNYANSGNDQLVRIFYDATRDTTFNTGTKLHGTIGPIVHAPSGKIIVSGNFTEYDTSPAHVLSLNEDGSLHSILGVINDNVYLGFLGDNPSSNELLIGGEFSEFNGFQCNGLIKLSDYASTDTNYKPEFTNRALINIMEQDSDNKLLVAGWVDYIFGEKSGLARINPDGTQDTLFNSQVGSNSDIYDVEPMTDGNILIGGYVRNINTGFLGYLVKLDQSGNIVTEFNVGQSLTGPVFAIETDENNKILVGGYFLTAGGSLGYGILRLNSDGSIDETFASVFDSGTSVEDIEITGTGDILVSGELYFGGNLINRILRLNPDGQIDSEFNVDPMPNNSVQRIKVDKKGKIYISGLFNTLNGATRKQFAKLNANGSIDNSFSSGTGFEFSTENYTAVFALAVNDQNNIYIGGVFNLYNGMNYNGIVLLDSTGTPDPQFALKEFDYPTEIRAIVCTPENDIFIGGKIIEKQSGLAQAIVYAGYPPADPTSLSVNTLSTTTLEVSWTDNSDSETGFIIERKSEGEDDFQVLATLDPNLETYIDAGGEPNTYYYYRSNATRSGIESGYSNVDSALTLLIAPEFYNSDSVSQSAFNISWTPVEGAEYYILDVSTDEFSSYVPGYEDSTMTVTEFTVTNLEENTKYYARISAESSANHSINSATLIINTWPSAPAAPSLLNVSIAESKIILVTWTDNSDNETGFILERKTGDGEFIEIDSLDPNSIQYLDENTDFNTNYSYKVTAFRVGTGTAEDVVVKSAPSSEGLALTLLAYPVFIGPDSVDQTTINISWSQVEDAEFYNLDVSTDEFSTFLSGYEDSTINITAFQVTGLEENTKYYFRVSAGTTENHSLDSDTLVVNTWPQAPAAPTELTVAVNESDQIIVTWTDNSDNEGGFIILRKAEDGEFSAIDTVSAEVNQYQDESAEINTNYSYKVFSYRQGSGTAANVIVTSDPSNEGSVIILGWENVSENAMIRIYPNPSTGIIYVSIVNARKFPVDYTLYNQKGQIIRQSKLDRNRNSIDIREFIAGVYVLLLDIDGVDVRKKLLKY